ncbi:polyprenyl synthetase family protein [Saccharopolyspora terrae]|uniref:Polyprenyl synthetase family protein n=1 Tax=Saccharopolyspora terrae TaxID=2530384 RepID=A0A4R4VDB3_9PSEU|nr:polyprenyl synthetase family protein [Saccharopolyspora terrae]TDC99954.1 polyprenyl synthetase family protein [Saccharopolyspora terrae]
MTATVDSVRSRVDDALAEFMRERIYREKPLWGDAIAALISEYVTKGGKRLRPELCYWGWRAAGGSDTDSIIKAAASLELFHAFCLAHDDVMDNSDTRRGKPSLHRSLEKTHRDMGWSGNPTAFGRHMAILAGDLLMSWSDQMFQESGVGARWIHAARPLLAQMRSEVVAGQQLDLRIQHRTAPTLRDALRVIEYKTARYTVQRPLQIGAKLTGDASPGLMAGLASYGVPLGEAFQLRDDVLGVFGDPSITGKPVIDDIRDGKQTALIIIARELAGNDEREVLDRWYGNPKITQHSAKQVRQVITSTGALEAVENMIGDLVADSLAALEQTAAVHPDAKQELAGLVDRLTRRDA